MELYFAIFWSGNRCRTQSASPGENKPQFETKRCKNHEEIRQSKGSIDALQNEYESIALVCLIGFYTKLLKQILSQ